MSDRRTPISPGPPSAPAADGKAVAIPPHEGSRDAVLREELEVWVNEGGAGDEPGP